MCPSMGRLEVGSKGQLVRAYSAGFAPLAFCDSGASNANRGRRTLPYPPGAVGCAKNPLVACSAGRGCIPVLLRAAGRRLERRAWSEAGTPGGPESPLTGKRQQWRGTVGCQPAEWHRTTWRQAPRQGLIPAGNRRADRGTNRRHAGAARRPRGPLRFQRAHSRALREASRSFPGDRRSTGSRVAHGTAYPRNFRGASPQRAVGAWESETGRHRP
jgi:hypothetical protein